ncbi:DUF7402 domain-containing protein [Actinopolymorpha pittospori]|uniref:Lysophospholipase L1-like esterase n=1 Tax=Actinopolymorpha pittospori TaxID=648752 RepID=A0A927R9I8_9ACTN|nr:lysophospholipase L1-like esterase [Actinopolymorpha pittospori]
MRQVDVAQGVRRPLRRFGVLVAGMAVLLAASTSVGESSSTAVAASAPTPQGREATRLFTFGHSYVAGLGASKPDRAWPSIVAARTCRPLVNKARSSDLSAETENQFLMTVNSFRRGDVVVIETGINDVRLFGPDADLANRYAQHLTEMLSYLRSTQRGREIPVVFVVDPGISASTWSKYPPYDKGSQEVADDYAEKLKDVAADMSDISVVDVRSTWSEEHIAADGVHPNDTGHATIAAAVGEALRAERLGRCQDVTRIQVHGPELIEEPYGTARFTATFAPRNSLHQATWSVTEPDGSPTDRAVIDDEGTLTVNHRDGDVLVTATAADGAGARASMRVHLELDKALLRGNAARWPGAEVTASSTYNSDFGAENARDGVIQADGGEWASAGEQNPWIELRWAQPVRADRVVLYDRAGIDDLHGGTLSFGDGSTVEVRDVPTNGDAQVVTFAMRTFTSLRFQVEGGTGPNVGMSEFEVHAVPSAPQAPAQVAAVAGERVATVSWSPPAFDGGAPLTGYVVTPYRQGVALDPVNVDAGLSSVAVTGLSAGQAYEFGVAARNIVGTGPESARTEPVVPT